MTYLKVLTSLFFFGYLTCVQSTEFYFECLKTKIDFTTAQKLCEEGGRKLVTIRNEQEETALKTLIRSEECLGKFLSKNLVKFRTLKSCRFNLPNLTAPFCYTVDDFETVSTSVKAKWRHAWLNYQAGRWLDGYPLLYNNWIAEMPSTRCAKFSQNGWIIRTCSVKAASVLLCENRGNY